VLRRATAFYIAAATPVAMSFAASTFKSAPRADRGALEGRTRVYFGTGFV
jgi:hypothetical protein